LPTSILARLPRGRPDCRRKFAQGDPFYKTKVRHSSLIEVSQMIVVVHGGAGDD
jgi:hypothetical protein